MRRIWRLVNVSLGVLLVIAALLVATVGAKTIEAVYMSAVAFVIGAAIIALEGKL